MTWRKWEKVKSLSHLYSLHCVFWIELGIILSQLLIMILALKIYLGISNGVDVLMLSYGTSILK